MSDKPKKTIADWKQIAPDQAEDFRDWAVILGCTEDELRKAVKAVDSSVLNVREYLNEASQPRQPSTKSTRMQRS